MLPEVPGNRLSLKAQQEPVRTAIGAGIYKTFFYFSIWKWFTYSGCVLKGVQTNDRTYIREALVSAAEDIGSQDIANRLRVDDDYAKAIESIVSRY